MPSAGVADDGASGAAGGEVEVEQRLVGVLEGGLVLVEESEEVDSGVDPLAQPLGAALSELARVGAAARPPKQGPLRKRPDDVGVRDRDRRAALFEPEVLAFKKFDALLEDACR